MNKILFKILNEIDRAEIKHPVWPTDNVKRIAIVVGEAGEALKEAIKLDEGKGSLENLETELIQTAGTCIRMLKAIKADKLTNPSLIVDGEDKRKI